MTLLVRGERPLLGWGAILAAVLMLGPGSGESLAQHRSHGGPSHGGPRPPVSRPAPRPAPHHAVRPAPRPAPRVHVDGGLRFVLAPPSGYVTVSIGGTKYYRHGGVYYRPHWYDGRWVYYVVSPPVGVVVTTLPPAPERVVINGHVYYRDGATFYVQQSAPPPPQPSAVESEREALPIPTASSTSQYVVVRPPIGATVDKLPDGASSQNVGGAQYFQAEGIYYLPVVVGEQTKYIVVEKPAAK
ncbi:MAG: hypothetical protein JW818_02900 [Pirellulales bacterium]|nr:hypothetical protein [Pirellulales bacterium]